MGDAGAFAALPSAAASLLVPTADAEAAVGAAAGLLDPTAAGVPAGLLIAAPALAAAGGVLPGSGA